jgi:hypothetical protein
VIVAGFALPASSVIVCPFWAVTRFAPTAFTYAVKAAVV